MDDSDIHPESAVMLGAVEGFALGREDDFSKESGLVGSGDATPRWARAESPEAGDDEADAGDQADDADLLATAVRLGDPVLVQRIVERLRVPVTPEICDLARPGSLLRRLLLAYAGLPPLVDEDVEGDEDDDEAETPVGDMPGGTELKTPRAFRRSSTPELEQEERRRLGSLTWEDRPAPAAARPQSQQADSLAWESDDVEGMAWLAAVASPRASAKDRTASATGLFGGTDSEDGNGSAGGLAPGMRSGQFLDLEEDRQAAAASMSTAVEIAEFALRELASDLTPLTTGQPVPETADTATLDDPLAHAIRAGDASAVDHLVRLQAYPVSGPHVRLAALHTGFPAESRRLLMTHWTDRVGSVPAIDEEAAPALLPVEEDAPLPAPAAVAGRGGGGGSGGNGLAIRTPTRQVAPMHARRTPGPAAIHAAARGALGAGPSAPLQGSPYVPAGQRSEAMQGLQLLGPPDAAPQTRESLLKSIFDGLDA